MRSSRKALGCIIAAVTVLAILILSGYCYLQRANYRSALDATKKWARLSEFPASAANISVERAGGPFTREFTVTFRAPLEDINKWLERSPGTVDAIPTKAGALRRYDIEPGGGAQYAELEVDDESQTVRINVYWS